MHLHALEVSLNIEFHQKSLLELALTHSSFVNEQKSLSQDNERLEFLGDAVLGLCITDYLYTKYPKYSEGELSKLRSYVVSAESLAEVARERRLGVYVLLGRGEQLDGGATKNRILANIVEALIGAYYLDRGFHAACSLVLNLLQANIDNYQDHGNAQDAKSQVQSFAQQYYQCLPEYQTQQADLELDTRLPSANFTAKLFIAEKFIAEGQGSSKKRAEQHAALAALKMLHQGDLG